MTLYNDFALEASPVKGHSLPQKDEKTERQKKKNKKSLKAYLQIFTSVHAQAKML